jgi:hypothetical protein
MLLRMSTNVLSLNQTESRRMLRPMERTEITIESRTGKTGTANAVAGRQQRRSSVPQWPAATFMRHGSGEQNVAGARCLTDEKGDAAAAISIV